MMMGTCWDGPSGGNQDCPKKFFPGHCYQAPRVALLDLPRGPVHSLAANVHEWIMPVVSEGE
jgi:hypothetical protein